jgi:LacI family transcriptional regulator
MDVAREAGVSIAAVSRILNNSYDGFSAREETKARVFEAVKKLNYKASRSAVRLATGRHQAIALCYPSPGEMAEPIDMGSLTTVFAQMGQMLQIHGVSRVAGATGLDLVLMARGRGRSLEDILTQAVDTVDGIIYVQPEDDDKVLSLLEASETPVAVVGAMSRPSKRLCHVGIDEFTAGRMAMGHLIVAGARRIVVAVPQEKLQETALINRLEGAKTAVRNFSDPALGFDVLPLPADLAQAKSIFLSHVGKWGKPDGVLSLGGLLPFPILRGLGELRLSVPDAVKIVGFDESPMFLLNDPAITGIRYPVEEMCHKATEMLVSMVQTGEVPAAVTMTPRMMARRSSEAPLTPLYSQ